MTKEHHRYIVENYNRIPAKEIALKLNKKIQCIYDYVNKMRKEFPDLFPDKKTKYS
jgi:hypothetical protein